MPNRDPMPTPTDEPRGPTATPGIPDRSLEDSTTPPITKPGDTLDPNDPVLEPALYPIGDPAGMA